MRTSPRRSSSSRINPGHGSQRAGLRVLGFLLAGGGAVFTAIGLVSFFGSFGTMSGPPQYFWCAFVGLPMLGLGTMLLKFAYLGAIGRYVAGEAAPVVSDTLNYVAEETRPAMRAVGSALRQTLAGAAVETRCRACDHSNDADASFCDQCGAPLRPAACAGCGRENDADARFCAGCGEAIG